MDNVCDKNFTLTAAEMLEKAKASSDTERNITMNNKGRRNMIARIIGAAAACSVLSVTAVSAMGYGPLSGSFRKFFGKDEVTADIIDQGHYCEIDEVLSDSIFTVDLDSVTGDKSSPKLIFDVTVNDEKLAAENDRLMLSAYILDEYRYANELDNYSMWEAYGEKDPDTSNVYHICMDGPSAFMINGADAVVAVRKISFDSDTVNQRFTYDVDMEYRIHVPEEALKDTFAECYSGITLHSGNVDYDLCYAEYGSYDSMFQFTFDFLGTELAGGETDFYEAEYKFDDDWHRFADSFVLTVDGTEYTVKEKGYAGCNADDGRCSTWLTFPAVNYDSAESITFTAGNETFTLK